MAYFGNFYSDETCSGLNGEWAALIDSIDLFEMNPLGAPVSHFSPLRVSIV